MKNLIKQFITFFSLCFIFCSTSNAGPLNGGSRADWPEEAKTALDVVSFLIEPYKYVVVNNTKASFALSQIQPLLLKDPYLIEPVDRLILKIIPSDIGIKIDEQNRRVQFFYMTEMVGSNEKN